MKLLYIILLFTLITGCAFGKINEDKPSWFIGWGKLKKADKEIESSPPIKIGAFPSKF